MNKKFYIKLSLFLLFALVIPITYMGIRFNAFELKDKKALGFWGIVVLALMISVVSVLIYYYIEGMKTKFSFLKQLLQGAIKLILPMCLLLFICYTLKNNIDLVIESLIVLIVCESIAIIINPLPKWCFDNNVEGIVGIADKIFNKHKEE